MKQSENHPGTGSRCYGAQQRHRQMRSGFETVHKYIEDQQASNRTVYPSYDLEEKS